MIAIFDCHLSHKQCSNSCDSDKSTDVCAPADVFIMDDAKKRQDEHRSRGHDGCGDPDATIMRSEEHTSELQSRQYLVCRLLLEKKKTSNKRVEIVLPHPRTPPLEFHASLE